MKLLRVAVSIVLTYAAVDSAIILIARAFGFGR
jgi:hypothetical protein